MARKSWDTGLGDPAAKDADDGTLFSVDPEMFEKTGVKKPRDMKDLNTMEAEKLYKFQVEKDIVKIAKKQGRYKVRNAEYLRHRATDPRFSQIAHGKNLGKLANFEAVSQVAAEARYPGKSVIFYFYSANAFVITAHLHSWQATTIPYGEIAHKRYLEWLANK